MKRLCLVVALLLTTAASAAEPVLTPFKASYDVEWSSMGVGQIELKLEPGAAPDCYRYTSTAHPGPLVRMLYGAPSEISELCVQGGRVLPRRFEFRNPREAEESGTEGEVRLRVSLTEEGRVHAVRVLSGLGHGLDAAAVDAIKNRCKFKPAIGRDGQPVAFVIESYKFHFELPR